MELGHHDDTYQDRLLKIAEECSGNENAPRGSGKKLASTIVSPYHASNENDVNVTFRSQIIEALHDMDIGGSSVGAQLHDASMDVDATDDDDVDLLGEELKEMEEPHHIASSSNEVARGSKARSSNKGPSRHGILRGMPVRKAEFLRRDSPRKRSKSIVSLSSLLKNQTRPEGQVVIVEHDTNNNLEPSNGDVSWTEVAVTSAP
ncbi:hypothetical protein Bca52824_086496 [Brassica carinata]|uniref:Uncharacterized protein n=1 Tax=Brassica carinata TaxID=52824 RepID=A0A8X7PA20_BRACI|nr:hypothetical protein Bca52824_086496 [Brassica carinata]